MTAPARRPVLRLVESPPAQSPVLHVLETQLADLPFALVGESPHRVLLVQEGLLPGHAVRMLRALLASVPVAT